MDVATTQQFSSASPEASDLAIATSWREAWASSGASPWKISCSGLPSSGVHEGNHPQGVDADHAVDHRLHDPLVLQHQPAQLRRPLGQVLDAVLQVVAQPAVVHGKQQQSQAEQHEHEETGDDHHRVVGVRERACHHGRGHHRHVDRERLESDVAALRGGRRRLAGVGGVRRQRRHDQQQIAPGTTQIEDLLTLAPAHVHVV